MIRAVILEFMYMHGPGVAWRTPPSLKSASVYGIFSQVSWDMGKQSKISTPTKKVPARRSMEMSSLVFAMTSRIVAVLLVAMLKIYSTKKVQMKMQAPVRCIR